MSTAVLSPLAAPFYPPTSELIFNDGVPSLVSTGGVGEVLVGISEDAIEELFPPTAEEVAELEMVEVFVQTLAHLSILEDKEEKARRDFGHIKKRWAKRREEGLQGRPKPARHVVQPSHETSRIHDEETGLVSFRQNRFERAENKIQSYDMMKVNAISKRNKGLHGFSKTIQQPRKRC